MYGQSMMVWFFIPLVVVVKKPPGEAAFTILDSVSREQTMPQVLRARN